MTCAHAVRVAISKFEGVESVDVSLQRGHAHVKLKPGNSVRLADVSKAVQHQALEIRNIVLTARGAARRAGTAWDFVIDGTGEIIPSAEPGAAHRSAGEWKLEISIPKKSKKPERARIGVP